ncbi:MAG: lysophospholipid acyltransferase family protein [Burkholderiales bacterium]
MSGRGILLGRRNVRITRVALHLMHGVVTIAFAFPFFSPLRRNAAIRRWSQQLLDIVGVRLRVHGQPPQRGGGPAMVVANHVSWLDIYVINAVSPVRFVAKSEIRRWPVIGWLSMKTGTLFIERSRRRDTARITGLVSNALLAGEVCAVFPEGTTTDGSQVLPFHSSLLQPASIAGAEVYPVALRFERADNTLCTEAAYDGDKSLWQTLRDIVAQPVIHAHVWFLDPVSGRGADRRTLARSTHQAIARRLAT